MRHKFERFGVEHEFFVLAKDNSPPELSQMHDYFVRIAEANHGKTSYRHNIASSVLIPTTFGNLEIKNDYCTHILEFAFPPVIQPSDFITLFADIENQTRHLFDVLGLTVVPGGVIEIPREFHICPSHDDSGQRTKQVLSRALPHKPLANLNFNAAIAATQIHLDLFDEKIYGCLPILYDLEYIIPLCFSESTNLFGCAAHCIRPLVYFDNFEDAYLANAVPISIPHSKAEYERLLGKTKGFIRDYSFIAPTAYRTIEFRTGCSQKDVNHILEMVAFRVVALMACLNKSPVSSGNSRKHFIDVCISGNAPESFKADLNRLVTFSEALSPSLRIHFDRLMDRACSSSKILETNTLSDNPALKGD